MSLTNVLSAETASAICSHRCCATGVLKSAMAHCRRAFIRDGTFTGCGRKVGGVQSDDARPAALLDRLETRTHAVEARTCIYRFRWRSILFRIYVLHHDKFQCLFIRLGYSG